ncbi:hypothetical protein LMG33818_002522 [Halomonadaceae bacterium LMG 33818]|uniref:preprotein translocase subunit SecG n=1 Tax=Cernens ardua TaxID=3402176 RepID=UPI003EDCA2DA
MQFLILTVHVLLAIALVVLVLLQQGKGAEAGAAFGGGASQTVFGSRGSSSFLAKLTGGLAALFFITSLGLGWWANHMSSNATSGLPSASMIQQQQQQQQQQQDASGTSSASEGQTSQSTQSPSEADSHAQGAQSTSATPSLDAGQSKVDNNAPSKDGSTQH